jgi:ApaG protein
MKSLLRNASTAVTDGIRVETESFYVLERSDPVAEQFFFAYRIKITNEGGETAKLVKRHWVITDASGDVQEVRGLGVVGEQPRLRPGETFEYTSACPLETPVGSMRGEYRMMRDDGQTFDVEIAEFMLCMKGLLN